MPPSVNSCESSPAVAGLKKIKVNNYVKSQLWAPFVSTSFCSFSLSFHSASTLSLLYFSKLKK